MGTCTKNLGTISAEGFAEGGWIPGKNACIQGPEVPVWALGPMGPKGPFRVPVLKKCSRRSRQLTGIKACLQGPEGPVWAHTGPRGPMGPSWAHPGPPGFEK